MDEKMEAQEAIDYQLWVDSLEEYAEGMGL